MAFRPSAQPQAHRSHPKLNAELSDQVWNAMIVTALKYQRRVGRFHNQRYDRKFVYHVLIVHELSKTLVELHAIHPWPAGSRRLGGIERAVIAEFTKLHGKTHLDP